MNLHETDLKRILDAYLQGKATPEEISLLDDFFNNHKTDVSAENLREEDYALIGQEIRKNIERKISYREIQWMPVIWKIAASVSAILFVAYLYYSTSTDKSVSPALMPIATLVKSTESGQKITIKLPDGTTVKLNSKSKLSFPEQFHGNTREVTLEGEGYFDVAHNATLPFIVHTKDSKTQVLGTSFNVKSNIAQNTEVTLVSGKVKISGDGSSSSLNLKPNQRAVISMEPNKIDTLSVDVTKYVQWKDNVLAFEETPIKEAISQLEDWYGVTITLKGKALNKCRITARYESESLKNVLESFQFMFKGEYTLNGRDVTISGKGCNHNQ